MPIVYVYAVFTACFLNNIYRDAKVNPLRSIRVRVLEASYYLGILLMPWSGLHHVAGDIDDIQSTSMVMYEREFFMLTLLIPCPKSLSKDIDVYLRPLIEDLKVLMDEKGVETIDVASGQKFNMRAMVLWTINDFPASSSLSGWSGQGYKACPTCNKDTLSVCVLSKTAYVGHRRFLKKPHK
nr:hypothetical protein [Tanacetum cinerariifolium]